MAEAFVYIRIVSVRMNDFLECGIDRVYGVTFGIEKSLFGTYLLT